jgi:hypothetical protein
MSLLYFIGSDGNEGSLYTFIGDEAFPLKIWLMRPIPGQSTKKTQSEGV